MKIKKVLANIILVVCGLLGFYMIYGIPLFGPLDACIYSLIAILVALGLIWALENA